MQFCKTCGYVGIRLMENILRQNCFNRNLSNVYIHTDISLLSPHEERNAVKKKKKNLPETYAGKSLSPKVFWLTFDTKNPF